MNKKPIAEITLERFLLNDLDAGRMSEIRDMMASDAGLRSRIEDMERSGREILARYPSENIVPVILEKSHKDQASVPESILKTKPFWSGMFSKRLVPALAFAAVFAAVTFLAVLTYQARDLGRTTDVTEVTRAKGLEPGLYLYRKKGGEVEVLRNGSIAGERDLVQIAYMSTDHDHGLIFSIDGNGSVTLQYPDRPGSSTMIATGKKVLLQSSYELDNAPGFEKFVFITSPEEIDVDIVLENAQKIARIAASDKTFFAVPGTGQRQYVFTLKKREPK